MAIIGSLFAVVGRFAGRVLNAVLGWATLLLFGKVEGRKQTMLLVIALAALLWVVTLVGILVPDIGTFLLAFVPVPDFIDEGWVRLAMLAAAVTIPLLIGTAAVWMAEQRPKGMGLVTGILRGYPFTLVLAVTIVTLAAVAPVRKLRSLSKHWEDAHVPIVVKPGGYDRVLDDLRGVLEASDLPVQIRPAPSIVSMPPRLLDAVAGRSLGGLVPDRLMLLIGQDLEILVYPSDVAISGSRTATARARAAIAVELTKAPAYMTTSAEAQRIEDAIAEAAGRAGDAALLPVRQRLERLRGLDPQIAHLSVPFDEWETVYRQRLQVERDLMATDAEAISWLATRRADEPSIAERAFALGTVALIAADAVLLLGHRIRPRSGR